MEQVVHIDGISGKFDAPFKLQKQSLCGIFVRPRFSSAVFLSFCQVNGQYFWYNICILASGIARYDTFGFSYAVSW